MNCWVIRNFINLLKRWPQQILNYLGLLDNLQILYMTCMRSLCRKHYVSQRCTCLFAYIERKRNIWSHVVSWDVTTQDGLLYQVWSVFLCISYKCWLLNLKQTLEFCHLGGASAHRSVACHNWLPCQCCVGIYSVCFSTVVFYKMRKQKGTLPVRQSHTNTVEA